MNTSLADNSQLSEEQVIKAAQEGLGQKVLAVSKIGKGRNSKVYQITCPDGQYAAKFYFQHASDTRDRMGTEYGSFSFLWEQGLRVVPRPVALIKSQGCAFYEFICGSSMAGDKTKADVDAAADFLETLARLSAKAQSGEFAAASAACFSFNDCVQNIQGRLDRIQIQQGAGEYDLLHRYLREEFIPLFKTVSAWSLAHLQEQGITGDQIIPRTYQTLSPSDFGFHNALRQSEGRIVFLDFEYFGWDDPAKMTADFLWHPNPAMNLKEDLKNHFVRRMAAIFGKDPHFKTRLQWLYPVFGLMWSLICLNEFITVDAQRRGFAQPQVKNSSAVRLQQLDEAKRVSDKIKRSYLDFPYAY